MASGSLLNNRQFNKLLVNRLQANEIKAKNEDIHDCSCGNNDSPSWLFSLMVPIASWTNLLSSDNEHYGTLIFDKQGIDLVTFSDRPKRLVDPKNTGLGENAEEILNKLFNKDYNNNDSFSIDPPNATLVVNHLRKQIVIEMMSLKTEGSKVTVEAKILHNGGEIEDFKNMSVNLFIDDGGSGDLSWQTDNLETKRVTFP